MQVTDLCITRRDDDRVLIEHLSFTVNAGERVAVIGEEGNGKSTLLRYLYDPASVQDRVDVTGTVRMQGARVGYLPQELPASDARLPVAAFLASRGVYEAADAGLLYRLAAALRLSDTVLMGTQNMGQLSGGEKVKVQLLAALAHAPNVLLLDEPTNDVDMPTLLWLEDFLNRCREKVLYVSHDETLLERTATGVIHLEQLHLKKVARSTFSRVPYRQYVLRRQDAFLRQEQVAKKEQEQFSEKEERYRRIYERVQTEQNRVSRQDPSKGRLLKKKMHTVMAQGARLEKEREALTARPVSEDEIDLTLPSVHFPRGKEALRFSLDLLTVGDRVLARDIFLTVRGGERIGIVGENGVGKTTLLRRIAAELENRRDVRTFVMPQAYLEKLPAEQTPVAFLAPDGDKDAVTCARTHLGASRFTREEMLSPIAALSGGQRAKLLLLKMALEAYDILLLDEPTRNLSPLSNPVVRGILSAYGGTVISVSHDRKYLSEVCTRVLTLTRDGLTETREGF